MASRSVSKDRVVIETHAGVAQLAEQLICNQQVLGSSPIASSSEEKTDTTKGLVGYPSGQRERTVNPPPSGFRGSNPLPTTGKQMRANTTQAGVAQLVELQPSKLDVAGSNPVARSVIAEGRRPT